MRVFIHWMDIGLIQSWLLQAGRLPKEARGKGREEEPWFSLSPHIGALRESLSLWAGFPGGSVVESACQCRRPGFNPWVWKIPSRRKWQSTPVFLHRKSHGQRSLVGYSPWNESESRSIASDSLRPYGLYRPWNSPGQNTGVGSLSLLQGIFPTQGLNPGLLHYMQILYQLSYQGSLLGLRKSQTQLSN